MNNDLSDNKIKVLLVDDEPLLIESLEIILTLNGLDIVGMAHDGHEALGILKEKTCDIILIQNRTKEVHNDFPKKQRYLYYTAYLPRNSLQFRIRPFKHFLLSTYLNC